MALYMSLRVYLGARPVQMTATRHGRAWIVTTRNSVSLETMARARLSTFLKLRTLPMSSSLRTALMISFGSLCNAPRGLSRVLADIWSYKDGPMAWLRSFRLNWIALLKLWQPLRSFRLLEE